MVLSNCRVLMHFSESTCRQTLTCKYTATSAITSRVKDRRVCKNAIVSRSEATWKKGPMGRRGRVQKIRRRRKSCRVWILKIKANNGATFPTSILTLFPKTRVASRTPFPFPQNRRFVRDSRARFVRPFVVPANFADPHDGVELWPIYRNCAPLASLTTGSAANKLPCDKSEWIFYCTAGDFADSRIML